MAIVPYRFYKPNYLDNEKITFWAFGPLLGIFSNLAPGTNNDTI